MQKIEKIMANVFYNFLNPAGSSYAPKMRMYRALKEMDAAQMKEYLSDNFTNGQLMSLLVEYISEELNQDEKAMPRIRMTQEQFDAYFRIIKPHQKKDDNETVNEEMEG